LVAAIIQHQDFIDPIITAPSHPDFRLINDCSPEEKVVLFENGIIQTICELIAETGSVCSNSRTETEERKRRQQRRNSNTGVVHNRGIGYGHGSTRSRWDIERTVSMDMIVFWT
ncbi:hypothetical protein ANCCAN_06526, partial [Ancylostoma caninum]